MNRETGFFTPGQSPSYLSVRAFTATSEFYGFRRFMYALFYLEKLVKLGRILGRILHLRSICYDCEKCTKYLMFSDKLVNYEIIDCREHLNKHLSCHDRIRCCNQYFPKGKSKQTLFPTEEVDPKESPMT